MKPYSQVALAELWRMITKRHAQFSFLCISFWTLKLFHISELPNFLGHATLSGLYLCVIRWWFNPKTFHSESAKRIYFPFELSWSQNITGHLHDLHPGFNLLIWGRLDCAKNSHTVYSYESTHTWSAHQVHMQGHKNFFEELKKMGGTRQKFLYPMSDFCD